MLVIELIEHDIALWSRTRGLRCVVIGGTYSQGGCTRELTVNDPAVQVVIWHVIACVERLAIGDFSCACGSGVIVVICTNIVAAFYIPETTCSGLESV